jgi:hypothetical protein
MTLRYARNFTMRDVEIRWEKPESPTWKAGLQVEDVRDLLLEGVNAPMRISLKNVENVTVRQSRTPVLQVSGAASRGIRVLDSEGTLAAGPEVAKGAVVRR